MSDIKTKFKHLFFGRPKVEMYTTRTPKDVEKLTKKILEENAYLKAQLLRYKAKEEKERLKKKREFVEREQKEYILEQKEKQKQLDESMMVKLPIFGLKDAPTFFTKSDVPYKKFKGFVMRQTSDGLCLWYPWLTDNGGKSVIPKGQDSYAIDPTDIFRRKIGIVTQLKGGKVDSNYDIITDPRTGNERLVLFKPRYTYRGKSVRVIDLSDVERRDYDNKIKGFELQMKGMGSEMKKLEDRLLRYESKDAEEEVAVDSAQKERDTYASAFGTLAKKQMVMVKTVADVLSGIQDVKVQQILTEDVNRKLLAGLHESHELIERFASKEDVKETRKGYEELKSTLESIRSRITPTPPAVTPIPESHPPKPRRKIL